MFSKNLIAAVTIAATCSCACAAPPAAPPAASTEAVKPGKVPAPAEAVKPSKLPAEIAVGRFSASDFTGGSDKGFKGKTSYAFADGALKAHSVQGASGKIRKLSVDTRLYPRLTWSWKIEHTLKREDITAKSGDDFAARVYVIFPRTLFWKTKAISYVWAARMPKGTSAASPYTDKSVIVAVESGDAKAGTWLMEERDIYEDYKRIFGEEPPLLGGVAIMTDTDDTKDEATAWYGDITLHTP